MDPWRAYMFFFARPFPMNMYSRRYDFVQTFIGIWSPRMDT